METIENMKAMRSSSSMPPAGKLAQESSQTPLAAKAEELLRNHFRQRRKRQEYSDDEFPTRQQPRPKSREPSQHINSACSVPEQDPLEVSSATGLEGPS